MKLLILGITKAIPWIVWDIYSMETFRQNIRAGAALLRSRRPDQIEPESLQLPSFFMKESGRAQRNFRGEKEVYYRVKKAAVAMVGMIVFAASMTLAFAQPKPAVEKPPVKKHSLAQAGTRPGVKPSAAPLPRKFAVPQPVRGIYITSWIAGSSRIDELIGFVKKTQVNTLVIDVKDDTGMISYPSELPMAKKIGAGSRRAPQLRELLARLRQEHIYTIARIVVFKDPLLAQERPELAVRDKNGGLWRDHKGMVWVDPHSRQVWQYNLNIAKEAVALGFQEIQFDYVRFLSDGRIRNCVYPFANGAPQEDVIRDFLLYAKGELNAMGVPLSADIFGLVLSVPNDNNIGQKLEKIAAATDYISPMVYPSHYPKGTFGIAVPDRHPYEIVCRAMQDALQRIPGSEGKLRPWLQDFNLGNPYGREQLELQIKALHANGIRDWLFWNPSNRYDASKYPAK